MFNSDIQLCDDDFPPMESCNELRSPSQSYGINFPLKGFSHGQSSFPARRNQNVFFTMPDQTSSSNMFDSDVMSSRPVMQRRKNSYSYERPVSPIVTEPSSQPTSPKFPATIESIKHCFRRNGKENRSISDLAVFRNDILCKGWQSFQSIPPPDQLRKKTRRQPVWTRSLGKDVEDHIHLVKKKNAELLQSPQEIGCMMNHFVPIYAEANMNHLHGSKRPIEDILAPRKRVFLNPVNPFFKSAYDDSP